MSVTTGTKLRPAAVASGSVHGYTTDRMFEDEAIWREADRLRGDLVVDDFGRMYVSDIKKATGIQDHRRIRRVLDHPDLWSPYIDMIALERAMRYDWTAIDALTVREAVLFARLVYLRGDNLREMGETHQDARTPREAAWCSGSVVQRQYVSRLVQRHGDSEVARAAAATLGSY